MRKLIYILISLLAAHFISKAQEPISLKSQVEEIVKTTVNDPTFSEAAIGVCVRNGNGELLAEFNKDKLMTPASNVKLLTTGAALHLLGSGHKFETKIGYSGQISEGTLKGNLYIIGGGDPTLGSKDTVATNIETVFANWGNLIKEAGIKRIDGHIIGDGRWFDNMAEEETWLWNDIGTYYGTGVTGLMFYENMISFIADGGQAVGGPVNIYQHYPETPWMKIIYNGKTGEKGTGDKLYMYTTSYAPVGEIVGTFGIDRGRKRVDFSNKFPELTCAAYFAEWLEDKGIKCTMGAADFKLSTEWRGDCDEENIQIIGSTSSVRLSKILSTTNRASNNLYAETLLKTIGKTAAGTSEYKESIAAMLKIIKEMGIDTSKGIHLRDGSGLSRQDYVSADFFCRFLEQMMVLEEFDVYVNSLPSPGFDGSLIYNMRNYPVEIRERIKVKSGSMFGVRCYSGYIIPSSGAKEETIIFSILTNNCTSPTWKVRPLLDKFMGSLAKTN